MAKDSRCEEKELLLGFCESGRAFYQLGRSGALATPTKNGRGGAVLTAPDTIEGHRALIRTVSAISSTAMLCSRCTLPNGRDASATVAFPSGTTVSIDLQSGIEVEAAAIHDPKLVALQSAVKNVR